MQYAAQHRNTLLPFLAAAVDRQEWGIKFTADLDRAVLVAASQQMATENPNATGINYLKLKQLQRTCADQSYNNCINSATSALPSCAKHFMK